MRSSPRCQTRPISYPFCAPLPPPPLNEKESETPSLFLVDFHICRWEDSLRFQSKIASPPASLARPKTNRISKLKVSDIVTDNNVATSKEMWSIANARRAQPERDDRLYEFCMRHGPVSTIISKVIWSLAKKGKKFALPHGGPVILGKTRPLNESSNPQMWVAQLPWSSAVTSLRHTNKEKLSTYST